MSERVLVADWREAIQGAIDELPYQHHLIPRLVQLLEAAPPAPDPAGTNVNDKAHPRFVAGYDAGLRDGRAIADREAAEAPAPDPTGGPPVPEREAALIDALKDAAAHLAGAASAYRRYVRRHVTRGMAEVDPFFSTRADDFDKAAGRVRDALRAAVQTGGLNP